MNALILFVLANLPGQMPALVCAQPVVDRGTCRGGPAIAQSFEVANRGATSLEIVHIQPSCGCLASKLSARILRAGEKATIELTIGTVTQPEGDNIWSARLHYRVVGSETDRALDLLVKAKLVREVGLEPAALRLSGKPGLSHEMTLTDRREKPLEIAGVAVSSTRITAAADTGWQKLDQGWVRKIRVTLTEECPSGKHEDVVQIVSRDPDYREMRVPVTVVRRDKSRYQVAPAEVTLGGGTNEASVLLRDYLGQPVEIEKVEIDDPALAARFTAGPHPTASVRVGVVPGGTAPRWATMRIHVKTPVAQVVTVPIAGPSPK